ncbi:MAG: GGDEF domain-containing protein, partial [Gammaproteobacteria bacterium]|nr:GGDEF domain-containing protein [Gammaproteobacteria bacterium]
MEYKYSLAKLQDDKENIEELITRQSQRVGPVFPQHLEQEFWTKNLERARKHVEKYVWGGVLAYFIFLVVMIPTDYWIISKEYFVHDFVLSMFGLLNGGMSLILFYMFSCLPKIKRFF